LSVNPSVLIPRPETEELTQWLLKSAKSKKRALSILDIGTGSGCIALGIKKNLPGSNVTAIDKSSEALVTARKNSDKLQLMVDFYQLDILDSGHWKELGQFDFIVSNPPYVLESEKNLMDKNVVENEPPVALFVPESDPLIFYRTIASFSKSHLKPNGSLFFEIHEKMGKELMYMLGKNGFNSVELKQDLSGKNRMIRAFIN